MSVKDLAQLKKLAEEATPGPWKWFVEVRVDPNHVGHFPKMKTVEWDGDWGKYEFGPDFEGMGQSPSDSVVSGVWHQDNTAGVGVSSKPNAEYIAAANPSTILALLAQLEQAERERDAFSERTINAEMFANKTLTDREKQLKYERDCMEQRAQSAESDMESAEEALAGSEAALRTLRQASQQVISHPNRLSGGEGFVEALESLAALAAEGGK